MKKIWTAVAGPLIILAMIGIVGCSNFFDNAKDINPADAVETTKNNLSIVFAADDSAAKVTKSLTLATAGDEDVSISWGSSNPLVVTNTGVVTRPAFGQPNVVVTLTATITKNGITEIKTFEISVTAYPDSSHADVLAAKASLALGFTGSDTAEMVTGNLALDLTGANDVAISWETSDTASVSAAGVVARPAAGQSDAVVTLTATLAKGTETEAKTFTVTIKAELHRYMVTYDGNGSTQGTVPTDSNRYLANAEVTVAALGDLRKTGYSFAGWNARADGGGTDYAPAASFQMPGESLTLYAKWIANTYTVTFNSQTGTAASPASKSVTYASTYGTLATTTRTGYTLSGWYTGVGGTGTNITSSSAVAITTDQTLYAFWAALPTYTVTYSGNVSGAGTVPTDANRYLAGTSATVLGNTGRLYKWGGYYFDGWNTNAAGTGTDYASGDTLEVQGNLTLYAKWTKYVVTKHVVIFRDDGSEWNQPSTYGDLLANEIGMTEGSGIAKYEYITSAAIPTYTPTVGDILIIAASQPTAFYNAYRTNKAKFDSFVNSGGVMFWVYSDCGMPNGRYEDELPGGVLKSYSAFENYDDIVNSAHPITAGITSTHFYGSQASAGGFSNLDSLVSAGTISNLTTLIVQSSNRLPSLVEYSYGSGKVLATTVILDYYVSSSRSEPYYTIAVNSLKYLLDLM